MAEDRIKRISSDYFDWLCDLVKCNSENRSYYILFTTLHKREFYGFVPNDNNRITDGQKLRELFVDDFFPDAVGLEDYYVDALSGPCSVLEMLIALAKRIEDDILFNPETGDHMVKMFWEMLSNLGLDEYDDEHYYEQNGNYICDKILTKWLSRKYDRRGRGGLFPLRRSKEDQRKVEIWYQMSAYLAENY